MIPTIVVTTTITTVVPVTEDGFGVPEHSVELNASPEQALPAGDNRDAFIANVSLGAARSLVRSLEDYFVQPDEED